MDNMEHSEGSPVKGLMVAAAIYMVLAGLFFAGRAIWQLLR
jgi:hypothetical protein